MIKYNELMDFMVRDDRKTTKHYLEEELYNNGNPKIERLERLKQLMERPLCFDPFGQTGLLTLAII